MVAKFGSKNFIFPKFSIFAAGEPPAAEAAATAKIENFAEKTKKNAKKTEKLTKKRKNRNLLK